MAEDALDAIAPETPAEPVAPPEPAPEPVTEPSPAEAVPVAQPAPKTEFDPAHYVPLGKALPWRDERNDLRKENARLKAEAEARATPQAIPDPIDDPRGYDAHIDQVVTAKVTANKFEMSKVIAEQVHGSEEVDAALNWAKEKADSGDLTFIQKYMQSPHPIDEIVRQHKRDSLVSQLPTDIASLDELIERKIAERGLSASPAAVAPVAVAPQAQIAAPPRSIASETPSATAATPMDPRADFLAIFDKG